MDHDFVVIVQINESGVLHVALNSFGKHCSNAISTALHFVYNQNPLGIWARCSLS